MIKYILIIWALLIATTGIADTYNGSSTPKEYKLLDLNYFDMEFSKFKCNYDPKISDGIHDCADDNYRIATTFDFKALEYLKFHNWVHTETYNNRIATVGWQWEFSLTFSQYIQPFWAHHSQHVFDGPGNSMVTPEGVPIGYHFPVEDSYGIKFIFIDKHSDK